MFVLHTLVKCSSGATMKMFQKHLPRVQELAMGACIRIVGGYSPVFTIQSNPGRTPCIYISLITTNPRRTRGEPTSDPGSVGRTWGELWLTAFTLQKSKTGYTNSSSPRFSLCSVNRAYDFIQIFLDIPKYSEKLLPFSISYTRFYSIYKFLPEPHHEIDRF